MLSSNYWAHINTKNSNECSEAWITQYEYVPKNLRDANGITSLFERRTWIYQDLQEARDNSNRDHTVQS